jgi:urease accessory protein
MGSAIQFPASITFSPWWWSESSRQLGCRALWLVPTTFVAVMAVVAGALGIAGIGVPFVEIGIAVLVVVFGAIVAFDLKAPTVAAMGVVGLFAVFHGHAHGAEIPEDAGGVAYAAGFITATALLHLAGIGAGFLIGKAGEHYGSLAVRLVGGFATAAGWRFSLAFSDLSRGVPHNLSGISSMPALVS